MTLIGYDTAAADFLVPPDAQFAVCYSDGLFRNVDAARARFPQLAKAGGIIALTVRGNPADGEDIEPGNVGPSSAVPFTQTMHARGARRPWLYADLSDMRTIISDLETAGIHIGPAGPSRPVRLHTAHPNGQLHICGPGTCGQLSVDADATQFWWSSIQGRWHGFRGDLDVSAARGDAFATPQPPTPTPPEDTMALVVATNKDGRLEVFVEKSDGSVAHIWQTLDQHGNPAGFRTDPQGNPAWSPLGKP